MANSIFVDGLLGQASLAWPLGTSLQETALGTIAMVSTAATNQIQVPNGSNPEYGAIRWVSNALEYAGVINGGTARHLRMNAPAGGNLLFAINGADKWYVDTTTFSFFAITDNSIDIGASGAHRPRSVYAGTSVIAPAYTVGSTAGASGSGTVLTALTVVNGIVTAISIS